MKFLDRIHEILIFLDFGGPAGGSRAWKGASPPNQVFHMTRRAFLSLRVLIICNIATGEIGSEKRSPFLKLQNLLFNLIAPRVQMCYKFQLFFNDSENHIKSSLRTGLQKHIKNDSKNHQIFKLSVFFESLKNSKTSLKPI